MKAYQKTIAVLIFFSVMILMSVVHAESVGTDGNVMWSLSDDGVLTISGNGAMDDFGWNGWPSEWRSAETLVVEDNVTSIGNYAFYNCRNLLSVTLPSSITRLGENAFSDCTGLTEIDLPADLVIIDEYAFLNCSGLTAISIPDGVATIGEYAFYNCSGLTSITIPDSVTNLDDYAFGKCSGLTNAVITASIGVVPGGLFSECTSLTNVVIPDGITNIGMGALYHCSGLISITIPDSVTSIGNSAFLGCTALTDVYYGGTKAEWNAISFGTGNAYLIGDENSDGPEIHFTGPSINQVGYVYLEANQIVPKLGVPATWTLQGTGLSEAFTYDYLLFRQELNATDPRIPILVYF